MRIQPQSTITLYKNVTIDSNEQLAFSSVENQRAYFESKIAASNVNCTVVRKTGSLRVDIAGGIVSKCNYLSFINPNFDNKIVYARIVDYEYVNNECVEIYYVIDYWQTWMFDVVFEDSYIEREHLSQEDWEKAERNPYDPSIYEFRTNEALPVTKDMEKPYYSIGTSPDNDGVFVGEQICSNLDITNKIGAFILFSDINLENLDTHSSGTPTPTNALANLLVPLVYNNWPSSPQRNDTLNFIKLSPAIDSYFADHVVGYSSLDYNTGGAWDNFGSYPLNGNKVTAPVSYIYIDDVSEYKQRFSDILMWFTDSEMLDQLLGIYPIPRGIMVMSSGPTEGWSGTEVLMGSAKYQSVTNKKLDLFPYSYYRILGPNGDEKELKMEDFHVFQSGVGEVCSIIMALDAVEKPNMIIAPRDYKASDMTPGLGTRNANILEAMIYSQFPTLPYAIDGFRSQMAAVANSIIGNNTVQYRNEYDYKGKQLSDKVIMGGLSALSGAVNTGVGIASGKTNAASVAGGIISSSQNLNNVMNTMRYEAPIYENEGKMREDAYNVLVGKTEGALYENFDFSKPAHAGSIYHQINGDGIINFNINSFVDFILLRVSLNPIILQQYDRYFSNFGYSSGRCGQIRVVNYTKGITEDSLVPHWQVLNGKQTTYVKTLDCKVVHAMLPVAQYIKAMFDSGVRMIKGDPS